MNREKLPKAFVDTEIRESAKGHNQIYPYISEMF